MALYNFTYHPQFFTATILEWKCLLEQDGFKNIIIESLQFLHKEQSVIIYAFVIMPNHIHLIWQIQDGFERDKIQMRFLKYTAQQMKFRMKDNNDPNLQNYKVKAKDREYQFWERNSLGIDLWTEKVFIQKLDYIHNNPVQPKWKLVIHPEDYKYSSAKFYHTGIDDFGFLSHYKG